MKGKKRKGQRKTLQTNENTKISMQEVDEEKWIHMQAEAYYRAMKRIEAEKDEKPVEVAPKINRLYRILYVLNFLVFPFKIFGKVKLKEAAYNMPQTVDKTLLVSTPEAFFLFWVQKVCT